jgi:2-C-methyl-D-erythritol 4-phosphate cytidylyltransferase
MNIALIIAGGTGYRMHQDIPKQFLNVYDKPIIIYTLEVFQKHPDIDAIEVVCLDGWHDILKAYAKQFNITKLAGVVSGGENGQQSIRNGVLTLAEHFHPDDLVIVHDSIRPLLSAEIISQNIINCKKYGSSVTAIPCAEAMLNSDDGISSDKIIDRDKLKRTQTPQTFPLSTLCWAHKEALKRGITNSVATCTLMIELGRQIYMTPGSEKNIKLTTTDDIDIFKALLNSTCSSWMK